MIIREERKEDERIVEELIRECFYNIYQPGCSEHYLMHILRNSELFVKELNLVMENDQGIIIGQAACIKNNIQIQNGTLEVLSLGPICIDPAYQKQGLGKQLVDHVANKAKALGYHAMILEGNIDFYGKCGFVLGSNYDIQYENLPLDNANFFLVNELSPNYLQKGKYKVNPIYFLDDKEVESFDATFPYKQKEKRPGQLV